MTGPSPIGTDNYEIRSGTSVAAAFYGGIAALLLEYGIVNNAIPYLRTPEIKTITIAGCVQKITWNTLINMGLWDGKYT